ncbi:hypothetical protein [Moraxella pluranimalium]|uniref:Uncharacterized protein n=1 Tax=Moraxella pluranimalium TaxID=470453 RepID=A0A1T0CPX1_9GAMM|nr:hypothetical protein [Moraxella pluranimalium]OOS24221.1 hypothetical protein B0680_05430 [Moraxella pluranimalium]
MSVGLEIYDENGIKIFDANSRLTRIVGQVKGTMSAKASGEVVIPQEYLYNNKVFFIMAESAVNDDDFAIAMTQATIIVGNDRISYKNIPCDFIYGVY